MRVLVLSTCLILIGSGCAHVQENTTDTSVKNLVVDDQASDAVYDTVTSTFTLPILLYHHIGPKPAHISDSNYTWYVSEEKFASDLQAILDAGYKTMFFSEALDYLDQEKMPEKAVIITFDDGAKDYMSSAFPILQAYEMKSTMFLQSHVRSSNWLSEDDIRSLHDSGLVEFGSHTKYHEYLTRVSEVVVRKEIQESKEKIESLIEQPVQVLSYPFGLYNDRVEELVEEAGYEMALTIDSGVEQHIGELFSMKRIIVTEQLDLTRILP